MNHLQSLCDVKNADIHGEIIVNAHPLSKNPKIRFDGKTIEIWVKEPANKNKANKAILKALNKFFKRTFKFKKGLKNKKKIVVF